MKSIKVKILIVEDEKIASAQLKKMLSNLGFDVVGSADSGNDAIIKAAKLNPDLILMDICLECGMDGIETALRIRAENPIPVIFLTGDSDEATIHRSQACEPYGYIIKPYNMAMLNAAVTTALHRYELEKQTAAIKGELLTHQVELEMQNEELRKIQDELSVSKERYFDLFDLAPVGYFSLNESGIIIEANLTAASLLGVVRNSLVSQPFYRYIFSDDQSIYRLYNNELVNSWKPQKYEIRMARPDGTFFWVMMESSAAGIINYKSMCRVIISDITDRKKVEESQKQVTSLLQSTLESTTDGILVVDLNGKVTSFNKKFGELWHIPQKLIDTGDDNILIAFILDQLKEPGFFLAKVKELYKQPDKESFDIIEFKDGRVFERYSRPQQIDDKIAGRVWNFRNITDLKQADIKIHKLIKAVEYSPATVVITDNKGNIEYVNRKFVELTGYSSEEVIGKYPGILQSGNTPDELYKELWDTISSSKEWQGTFQNKKKNGGLYWESASIAPIINENGEITNYIAIKEDITERVMIEKTQSFLLQEYFSDLNKDFFKSLAQYLAENLEMDYVCIDRLEGDRQIAQTLAIYYGGKFDDNVRYTLKDTPCGDVVGKTICVFPENVRNLFPEDAALQELKAESYVGTTLWGSNCEPIGLIAVISRKPLTNSRLAERMLHMVSSRAAGVLEHWQYEEELRLNELHFRELADSISDIFFAMDRNLNYTFWNKASEILTDISSIDAIGKSIYDLFPEIKGSRVEELYLEVLKTNRPGSIEQKYQIKNKNLYFEITVYPANNGISVFAKNITERRQIEKQLEIEREFTKAIFDNAGTLIVVLDHEGRIRQFSRAAEELSGFMFAEVEGKFPWDTVLPAEDRDFVRKQTFEIFKNNPDDLVRVYENYWVSKDGTRYLIEWTNTLLLDADGNMEFMISIGIDVTKSN